MILLISTENDTMTDEISAWLSYKNKEFVRLNENQHITKVFFDLSNNIFTISVNNKEYDLNDFKSIFYRNGGIHYNSPKIEIDNNLLEFYNSELKSVTGFIYHYFRICKANVFGNLITKEVNKLHVLFLAKSIGLKIPDTYILSHTKDLSRINLHQFYITKSISEMKPIIIDNQLYLNYTREINMNNILQKKENIVPSLIQCKVNTIYEIRAFFFENKIWAIATFDFTDNIDIRNIKEANKKYIPCKLPVEIQRKIFKIANKLDLRCGTIDLLKSNNDLYFLEINPLGQFHQVSYYGNYQIDKYIAELL